MLIIRMEHHNIIIIIAWWRTLSARCTSISNLPTCLSCSKHSTQPTLTARYGNIWYQVHGNYLKGSLSVPNLFSNIHVWTFSMRLLTTITFNCISLCISFNALSRTWRRLSTAPSKQQWSVTAVHRFEHLSLLCSCIISSANNYNCANLKVDDWNKISI